MRGEIMKTKVLVIFLMSGLIMQATACGAAHTSEEVQDSGNSFTWIAGEDVVENATVAGAAKTEDSKRPAKEITFEEAQAALPNVFNVPEGAENVSWSILEASDENSGSKAFGPLIQLTFDLGRLSYTAREQFARNSDVDISGLSYDWIVTDDMNLHNWGRKGTLPGKCSRYIGDDIYVDLCTWYDPDTGATYSLTTSDPSLDGFDIQAIAEAMGTPDNSDEIKD